MNKPFGWTLLAFVPVLATYLAVILALATRYFTGTPPGRSSRKKEDRIAVLLFLAWYTWGLWYLFG